MDNDAQSNPGEKPVAPPVLIFAGPPEPSAPGRPLSYWIKKFFACNPFYLVSAAMLLYGVYLVSFDASFLGREISQLAFNFSSLQVYEILLVGTAIFLARHRIWYDSVLLVGLESLLVLVPFILISQAALLSQTAPLSQRIVLSICLAGAGAVLLRFWSLKQFFKDLNLPRQALAGGLVLLVINVVLPLVFRHLHDSKVGTKPTEGAAYDLNRYSWLLLLPAMFALINLLPKPRQAGDLLPQRRWLPPGLFGLWLAGSATHLYCLSYVYNFDWEFVFLLPVLWVVVWTVFLRHGDFFANPAPLLAKILLVPPLLVALIALPRTDHTVFIILTLLNLGCYLAVFLKDRDNLTAFHLLLISGATLLAGFIKPVESGPPMEIESGKWLMVCTVVYGLYWVIRSRSPKVGVWGAFMVGIATLNLVRNGDLGLNLAVQSALVFLLLHSLRWVDAEHQGASAARMLACVIWFGHGAGMVHWHWIWAKEIIFCAGGLLLVAAIVVRLFKGGWRPAIVPIAAVLVLLIPSGDIATNKLQTTPTGFLAIAGSFLLFGLGTLAALTKARWNPPAATVPVNVETNSTR